MTNPLFILKMMEALFRGCGALLKTLKRRNLSAIVWILLGWGTCFMATAGATRDSPWWGDAITTLTIFPIMLSVTATDDVSRWSKSSDKKVIFQARDDAAIFVASDSLHRGVFLDAALEVLKGSAPQHSDMELAIWIVTETSSTK